MITILKSLGDILDATACILVRDLLQLMYTIHFVRKKKYKVRGILLCIPVKWCYDG